MSSLNSRPNLTDADRNLLAQWLLQNSHNGTLRYGAQKEAALIFNIRVRTVSRVWNAALKQKSMEKPVQLVNMKRGAAHGNKKLLDEEKMKNLSVLERSSISKVAGNLGVSVGLVHKWIKQKKVRAHTNAIKLFLTDANKVQRLKWSLSMLTCISANGRTPFQAMYNIVHVDEKWFNLTKTSHRYYLLADEEEPHRTCKSKKFIEKIMFLCAVGRPQHDMHGNHICDGKFGIFPFIFLEPAVINSKNREKGTIITKSIPVINTQVTKDAYIKQLVPCIKQKWPEGVNKHILIQQDNAKPHFNNNDPDFQAAAQSDGFNMQLICQPSNSPDTNVNDLGFFRSIQSMKDKKHAFTVDDLIKNVIEAFEEYPAYKLNNVFLTLQGCYEEIIKVKGGNRYKIPHIGKDRLRREGRLPECIGVDDLIVQEAMEYLNEEGNEGAGQCSLESLIANIQQVNLGE